jgi:hypothetical protein
MIFRCGYLISVIDDKSDPGSTDRQPAISAFERLIADGYGVFAGGLAGADAATVIDNRGEQAVFSDGPFVESKEYLVGVWVWEAPDLDVVLKLAAEASKVCDRKIEVRPFREPRRGATAHLHPDDATPTRHRAYLPACPPTRRPGTR